MCCKQWGEDNMDYTHIKILVFSFIGDHEIHEVRGSMYNWYGTGGSNTHTKDFWFIGAYKDSKARSYCSIDYEERFLSPIWSWSGSS